MNAPVATKPSFWKQDVNQVVLLQPASAVQQRWFCLAVALLTAALWLLHSLWQGAPIFPVDDAYITLHNAQALHSGADPNFLGSPALTGSTSLLHTALVALLLYVLPPLWAMDVSLWLSILLYGLGMARLAFAFRASIPQALLVLLVGFTAARLPHQLLNGLETGMALAGITWLLALLSEEKPHPAVPILCGLLPFVRPELALLSLLSLAWRGWQHLRREERRADACRMISKEVGLALLSALPWLLFYHANTGGWVPATAQAKIAFFAEGTLPDAFKRDRVFHELQAFALTLGALTLLGIPALLKPAGRIGGVFAAIFLLIAYQQFPGALGHYEQRYLYIFIPFLLLGAAQVASFAQPLPRCLGMAVLLLATLQSVTAVPDHWQEHLTGLRFTEKELRGVAEWSERTIPASSTVLMHDAGYIAFGTSRHLVDFVGLKTPASIPYHQRWTQPNGGVNRGEALHEIALRAKPDYLIVLQGWNSIFQITSSLQSHGWHLDRVREGAYEVYRLTPPPEHLSESERKNRQASR